MAPLKARNAVLAHIEKKYPGLGLHLKFAEKEHTSKLDGLFRGDALREIMEGENYFPVSKGFPFVASFMNGSFGFVERRNFARMDVFYTENVRKLPLSHDGPAWTAEELAGWRMETSKFKTAVVRKVASYCSSALFTLKFYLLDRVVEGLKRFGSFSSTYAAPFEHINALMKQSQRTAPQRYPMRICKTVHNTGRVVESV